MTYKSRRSISLWEFEEVAKEHDGMFTIAGDESALPLNAPIHHEAYTSLSVMMNPNIVSLSNTYGGINIYRVKRIREYDGGAAYGIVCGDLFSDTNDDEHIILF